MDQADMADKIITEYLDNVIAAARGIRAEVDISAGSNDHCSECGEEIPAKRRQAVPGCRHCIDCAARIEHRQRECARPYDNSTLYTSLGDSLSDLEF